eukprot:3620424-Prymnesium_polylepis.1
MSVSATRSALTISHVSHRACDRRLHTALRPRQRRHGGAGMNGFPVRTEKGSRPDSPSTSESI